MKKGFTLIELLVVIGIISILMAVLVSGFKNAPEKAELAKCQELVKNTETALVALFDETVRGLLSGGELSENEAMALASMRVGRPGTSEHELGLAVDFREDEALFTWLRDNAWRYGFILRYPAGSEETTGRDADSCHYRYVGKAAAEQIHAMNATLEDYLSLFYGDSAQIIFE